MRSVREKEQLLSSAEVLQFIEATRAFCATVDQIDSLSEFDFLTQMQERLPLVYALATRIDWPWGQYDGEEEDDEYVLGSESTIELPHGGQITWWRYLRNVIGLKLGWHRLFHFVWDPVALNDRKVVDSDLASLIADIYIWLKKNMMLYDRGATQDRTQAVWQWKFGMELDWGSKAAEVMLPIHRLIHTHYDEDDEVFTP